MFKSASSYLWGSSAKPTETANKPSRHQSTASLPDLDELKLDSANKQDLASQSVAQLQFQPLQFKEAPTDYILDKESKYKLSSTSPISFLFDTKSINNNLNGIGKLTRYPYFIASNKNVHYVNKNELMPIEEQKSASSPKGGAINVNDLNQYLDSLNLTKEEKKGILQLCEWCKTEKISIKMNNDLWMSELIMTYFASLSPTNPDLYGCWKRWVVYRNDHGLYNVNSKRLKQFFDSGIFSIGFDNERRPIWFINTEHYDDTFGQEVITKACELWVTSLLWNLSKNEYDLFGLRRGLSVYVNMSHWSINMASWSILQSIKKAVVAFPFHLIDIYIINIPTFMYLLKQLAAKIVVPHAMEKFKILTDQNEYFEKYAPKHKTPICAGGTLKVSASQWMKDRGFLDYIENENKHKRAPSAPLLPPPSLPSLPPPKLPSFK